MVQKKKKDQTSSDSILAKFPSVFLLNKQNHNVAILFDHWYFSRFLLISFFLSVETVVSSFILEHPRLLSTACKAGPR